MSDQKVVELLNEKYDEEFTILNSRFSNETGLYYIQAATKKDPIVKFNVEFNPDSEEMTSYYEEYLWGHQAKEYFSKSLEKAYDKFVFNIDVRPGKVPDSKNIPSFEDLLKEDAGDMSINFQLHLFEDISKKNYKKVLKPVADLTSELIKNKVKDGAVVLNFYDEDHFKDNSLDDYSFGFTAPSMEDFEEVEKDYWKGKLQFKYDKDSNEPTEKDLYEFYTEKRFSFKYPKI